jgi:hypothetical protein
MNQQQRVLVRQALEAQEGLKELNRGCGGLSLSEINRIHKANDKSIADLRQLLEQPAPVAWHDKIMGMEVSMDVSTGDDDIDHRVYGTVYEVIFQDDGGTPDVILAIETDRNFTTPPIQPAAWVGLTDDEFNELYDAYEKSNGIGALMQRVEAKLREKNGGGA